jgi:hypothetical protein
VRGDVYPFLFVFILFFVTYEVNPVWFLCGLFFLWQMQCEPWLFFCGLLQCQRRSLNSVSALPFKAIRILLGGTVFLILMSFIPFTYLLPSFQWSYFNLDVDWSIILIRVLEKYHVKMWAGFILLKTGSNWPLWTRKGAFGCHKSRGFLDQLSEYHPSGKHRTVRVIPAEYLKFLVRSY